MNDLRGFFRAICKGGLVVNVVAIKIFFIKTLVGLMNITISIHIITNTCSVSNDSTNSRNDAFDQYFGESVYPWRGWQAASPTQPWYSVLSKVTFISLNYVMIKRPFSLSKGLQIDDVYFKRRGRKHAKRHEPHDWSEVQSVPNGSLIKRFWGQIISSMNFC